MGKKHLKIKSRNLLALPLIMTIFVLSACTGIKEADNYPLFVDDGNSGESVAHFNKAGDCWSFSILYITNEGDNSITINSVTLTDSENLDVIETSLMVIGEEKALLGFSHWPPGSTDEFPMSEFPNFDARIPAEGTVFEPGDGYNLIIAVKSLADKAHASGLEIAYTDVDGKQYVQKSHYAYTITNEEMK